MGISISQYGLLAQKRHLLPEDTEDTILRGHTHANQTYNIATFVKIIKARGGTRFRDVWE